HRTARACLEQALLAVERLPKTRDRLEQAIDLRFDLAMSLAPMGELAAGLQRLRESESLAESLGDRRRLGRARALLTENFWAIGEHTQAIAAAKSGLALAEEMGDHDTQSVATFTLGRTYYTTGDYPEALHWLKRTVASYEEDRRQEYVFPSWSRSFPALIWSGASSRSATSLQGWPSPRRLCRLRTGSVILSTWLVHISLL